jgi:tyrosyl-tRNA synthetase
MLAAESVKQRLETGLSFLEFNYTLLQAYDFVVLRRDRNCTMQFGGQDQWGNIVAGVDLARRMLGEEVLGGTFPLLLKSDGEKFGKTAAGAVWLDRERTSPFDYYQFWRNVDDADVQRLLGFFTPLPMDEVRALGALQAPAVNRAKEILAYEATSLAHGQAEAEKAFLAAGRQFGFADPESSVPTTSAVAQIDVGRTSDVPTTEVPAAEFEGGMPLFALLRLAELCGSSSEARRLIRGGGAYIGTERVVDENRSVTAADFTDGMLMLRAGKKNVRRIVLG